MATVSPRKRRISEADPNCEQQAQNQSRVPYSQVGGYMPNGTPSGPSSTFQQNQTRVVQQGAVRILCIADVRGKLCLLQ